MNKILISGSHGFIGQYLVNTLAKDNKVISIPRNLLYDPSGLHSLYQTEKPDYIYHLASYGNHFHQQEPPMILLSNIFGTMNLLWESKDLEYKRFINFSTSSVLLPIETFYSASKASAERIAQAFIQQYKKPILTIRPYSIYGPGEEEFRFIPTVIKALIFGETIDLDTTATHDWVFVEDFVDTLISLDKTGIVNLGTGDSLTNLDIVRKLERMSGRKLKYVEKKLRDYDNNDWVCPEHSVISDIDDGLRKTLNYYAKKFTAN